jgi:hypothetical protein
VSSICRPVARIRIDPRVIHVEHGWWFQLTDNQPPYDPAMEPISCEATLQGQRRRPDRVEKARR